MKLMRKIRFVVAVAFSAHASIAGAVVKGGIGGLADGMLAPVDLMSDFVYMACIIIGGSFVFASVIKYTEHRRSPLMVPISTVVFLFIAGVFLLLMPFLSYLYTGAIHFSLFG